MFIAILVAFFSIIILMIIHELGHFIIARKFGVRVEEFGIFFPPRLFGKKIGETTYSLNLIPLGAFVKVYGEEGGIEESHSFSGKPIWQRVLIIIGGIVSFWLVAVLILSVVANVWGLPVSVEDDDNYNLTNPKIYIGAIAAESPAEEAGIKAGDIIIGFERIDQFQGFIEENKGEEIILTIKRKNEVFKTSPVVPRLSPPEGEGALGVELFRVASKHYPWYRAPLEGALATGRLTFGVIGGWAMGIKHILGIQELPRGVEMELIGPVGIVNLLGEHFKTGLSDFFFFVALISIVLALINTFPIPALDGGKLLFLGIEKIKGSPVNPKIEQKITAGFFILLLALMVFVTIKDIAGFF